MKKHKYLISLYRNKDFYVVASFTTSQHRRGYTFQANKDIGKSPDGINNFSFPLQTTIVFDYSFIENYQWKLSGLIENEKIVGVLNEDEYLNLIYAMYQSDEVKQEYKIIFENILNDLSK